MTKWSSFSMGVILTNIDVPLPPGCTINAAPAIAAQLCDAFAAADSVTLDLSAVESCDLSFVQLVESGRLMAARDGKAFRLAEPASPLLTATLTRAGIAGPAAPGDIAFWHHGVSPQ